MPKDTPEALYERIQSEYTDADVLPTKLAKKFSTKLKLLFIELALLPNLDHMGSRVRRTLHRLVNTIEKHNMFSVYFKGEESLKGKDLILGNHQGPTSKNGGRQGGLEALFMLKVIPTNSRIVLKSELVEKGKGFESYILGRALRKANPIVVNRPNVDGMENWKKAEVGRKEQERISKEVFRVIEEEEQPVLIFPEGTRSASGKIRPMMKPFARAAITDYIIPRMRNGEKPKIGALISDTLQVFPEGLGGGAKLYRKSMTLRGVHMNTDPICEKVRGVSPNLEPSDAEIKQLAAEFSREVRELMEKSLCSILREPK